MTMTCHLQKSPNILLGRDYTAKIADVGIARVLTESHMSTVTSTGELLPMGNTCSVLVPDSGSST